MNDILHANFKTTRPVMIRKLKVTSGRSRCTMCQTVLADRRIISTSVEVHRRNQNDSHIPRCRIGKTYWHDNSHTKKCQGFDNSCVCMTWTTPLRGLDPLIDGTSLHLRWRFGAVVLGSGDVGKLISSFRRFILLSVSMGVQIPDSSLHFKALWRSLYRPSFARMFTLVSHFLLPRLFFFFCWKIEKVCVWVFCWCFTVCFAWISSRNLSGLTSTSSTTFQPRVARVFLVWCPYAFRRQVQHVLLACQNVALTWAPARTRDARNSSERNAKKNSVLIGNRNTSVCLFHWLVRCKHAMGRLTGDMFVQ